MSTYLKTCALCGDPIRGASVGIWTQPVMADGQVGAMTEDVAHPNCARMLDDDEDEGE